MSGLMTFLTGLSLAALAALSILRFAQNKNWRIFFIQMLVLALGVWFLHALFDFPVVAPRPRGAQDVYLVIILYVCMLLGMAAQYAYTRFEKPKQQRPQFDFGLFVAPIFTSPIVFIPLLAALQNANIDLAQLTVPKMMVFFVAFENGFFWKEYFDHRRYS
ncbi:MAG: hypothetical protein ONB44_01635 [candidate division KSB1 bacterium]|nr:hypothetical protein [candidate division KSB1 bacterium]MDZ7300822.1 hypothetical protein [candidate division KSB1 bacterium]MDZ7309907.1 hypothetical protein [candidate division KSB1 bacterium]